MPAPINVNHINPFLKATVETFRTMLNVDVKPGKLRLKDNTTSQHDISGIIGLSGGAKGAIAISFPEAVALDVVGKFIGETKTSMDEDVTDAVGELANIIAGAAKKDLVDFSISISLPSVITGKGHSISEAKDVLSMVMPFTYEDKEFELGVALKSS
jgi:chemotaxis protein CheX